MEPKILQQARLEQQQTHVESALSQVHVVDVEDEVFHRCRKDVHYWEFIHKIIAIINGEGVKYE